MSLSLDFLSLPLFVAAALVFVSVLAGVFSTRVGFSFLLFFSPSGFSRAKVVLAGWCSMISPSVSGSATWRWP
jgi:hypothetical protein